MPEALPPALWPSVATCSVSTAPASGESASLVGLGQEVEAGDELVAVEVLVGPLRLAVLAGEEGCPGSRPGPARGGRRRRRRSPTRPRRRCAGCRSAGCRRSRGCGARSGRARRRWRGGRPRCRPGPPRPTATPGRRARDRGVEDVLAGVRVGLGIGRHGVGIDRIEDGHLVLGVQLEVDLADGVGPAPGEVLGRGVRRRREGGGRASSSGGLLVRVAPAVVTAAGGGDEGEEARKQTARRRRIGDGLAATRGG